MFGRAASGFLIAIWMISGSTGVVHADERAIAEGRKIAEDACAACHAIDARDESPEAKAPRFRELGRKYPVESLEEALAEGVVVGHPEMPQVKMTGREIAVFLAYLKSVQVP